ncbi:MAG: serine/threonine-protein kinase [Polyangiaceae bacterium]
MNIDIGTLFEDRYRAARLLGRGGMGEVWACYDLEERRTVAIKVILAKHVQEPWVRRLFHAEIVAVARLSHPGIVEVLDLLSLPDGTPLLVMTLRSGRPLGSALSKTRSWSTVRDVLVQLLRALGHAHARSVLHLDLKPENVLLQTAPVLETTLVDFGIARVLREGRGAENWFEDGSIAGTPEYMAPEQWFGELERLGPWTDLYSVGVLAYELCSGRLPFEGNGVDRLGATRKRMEAIVPPLEPILAGIPDAFIELVSELLHPSPTMRPTCAAEVAFRLEKLEATLDTQPSTSFVSSEAPTVERPVSARVPSPESSRSGRASNRQSSGSWRLELDRTVGQSASAQPPNPGAYGLFGLRELPVLGRVEERRAVWATVREAVEASSIRGVLLSGPAGTGKTRLARDAVERAVEHGLAMELSTHWSASGSADEGLRGLVENCALGSRGSQGADFDARVKFFSSASSTRADRSSAR